MDFDLGALSQRDIYKLLTSVIVPRPIAFVTTQNADGRVNAAPFSFFNMCGEDNVMLGIEDRLDGRGRKDTDRNIHETGEFVIHLVDEAIIQATNLCAAEVPPDVEELLVAGLSTVPSVRVKPPRIIESPVAIECTLLQSIPLKPHRRIILGTAVYLHVRDDAVCDVERLHIDPTRLKAIGRFGGPWYARTSETLFALERPTAAQWEAARQKLSPALAEGENAPVRIGES
jgi:flavin reductase (DIM6/NTAB) family NADH-FMN oxidoreductase RutF